MDDTKHRELLRDYTERIPGQSEEADLIRSVHGMLGWSGDLAVLLKCLQQEATRLCELPHPLKFSLIIPLSSTPPRFLNEFILSVRCQSWFGWELILADRFRCHLRLCDDAVYHL